MLRIDVNFWCESWELLGYFSLRTLCFVLKRLSCTFFPLLFSHFWRVLKPSTGSEPLGLSLIDSFNNPPVPIGLKLSNYTSSLFTLPCNQHLVKQKVSSLVVVIKDEDMMMKIIATPGTFSCHCRNAHHQGTFRDEGCLVKMLAIWILCSASRSRVSFHLRSHYIRTLRECPGDSALVNWLQVPHKQWMRERKRNDRDQIWKDFNSGLMLNFRHVCMEVCCCCC